MSVLIVLFDCYQILQAFELLWRVYIHQFLRHFGSHILDNVQMLAENMASASFFRQMEQFVKIYSVEENREKPSFGRCRAVRSVIFLQFLNSETILIPKWENQNLGKQIQSDVVIFCIRDSAGISVPVSVDAEAADRRVQRDSLINPGAFLTCV